MTRQREQLRLLAMVCAGFLLPAAVILGLLFIPATGQPLGYLLGPYMPGVLMQLMLLVMAGLAAIGEIPRWVLVLPLTVWLGGVGYWWTEDHAIRERALIRSNDVAFPVVSGPLVVGGKGYGAVPLAQTLVGMYAIDAVYADQNRFRLSSGADCSTKPENSKARRPWRPEFLTRQDKCVIREKADVPAGGVEISIPAFVPPNVVPGFFTPEVKLTKLDIFERGKAKAPVSTLEIRQERGPLPVLLPVVGCWYLIDQQTCSGYLMRHPFNVETNPDRLRTRVGFLDNNAYFVARALGLKARPDVVQSLKRAQAQ